MPVVAGCNRTGEINVKNSIPNTIIENVYWGEVYVGGMLKQGQETGFVEITRSDEKLPAEHRIYFSIATDKPVQYYTADYFTIDRKGQIFVELTDSTAFYEVER